MSSINYLQNIYIKYSHFRNTIAIFVKHKAENKIGEMFNKVQQVRKSIQCDCILVTRKYVL